MLSEYQEGVCVNTYRKLNESLRRSGREVLSAVWSVRLNEERRLRMCDNNVLIAKREV
jgi:hypothetical protein